jgi:hypothetical protein
LPEKFQKDRACGANFDLDCTGMTEFAVLLNEFTADTSLSDCVHVLFNVYDMGVQEIERLGYL